MDPATATLALWGAAQATHAIFQPILEDLAADVAKDAAKGYVGQAFRNVFSVIHKKPLTKATGLALKELLGLIENELLDADLDPDKVRGLTPAVEHLVTRPAVQQAIADLFLDPDYRLDPSVLAEAWGQRQPLPPKLPEGFSWERIAKRLTRQVQQLREADPELRETFAALRNAGNADALKELQGLPPDFDLDKYREALVERFGNLSLDSMDTSGAYYAVRLWSVFVPQSVRECHSYRPQLLELPKEHQKRLVDHGELDPAELAELERQQDQYRRAYFDQPLRPVLEVCADPQAQRLVLLGDPGSGKSSLLRYLALNWARTEDINQRYTRPLPLLIELRDYHRWECPSARGFPRYLHEASTWHRLNQHTLDWLLKQPGRVVVLLDGLDEVFDPVDRERVVDDIHRFSNDYPGTRILVTSRVVGYKAERLRDAGFRDYMLQDLDDRVQIPDFLARWHQVTFTDPNEAAPKRERLAKAIRDSRPIAQLAGNPLLLTLMAIINRYQELPRDRSMLYEKAAEVLLQQWDTERGLQDFPDLSREIDLRAKTSILRRVATRMQTGEGNGGKAANIIQGEALIDLVERYLCEELRFTQARAAAQALVRQLRERNFILCFLGADTYAFVHRTFLEYFCATDHVHRFEKEKSLTLDGLIGVFVEHCRDDDWREVLRLICGQIDETFVGQIVESLAGRVDVPRDEPSALYELPLCIYCLSEVANPVRLEQVGRLVLRQALACFGSCQDDSWEIQNAVVHAARVIGDRWPGLEAMREVVLAHQDRIAEDGIAGIYWPAFLAAVIPDRDHIAQLTKAGRGTLRAGALRALAETWPDAETRRLLTERAVQGGDGYVRLNALSVLAGTWSDAETRRLLTERAVQDEDGYARGTALEALAMTWPEAETRRLLAERVVQDEDDSVRRTALWALSQTWPDAETRRLLAERAVQDEDDSVRRTALWALSQTWPDAETHSLLTERAAVDGAAAGLLVQGHSRFGDILFTRDLDGAFPYLDPRDPLPRDHIKKAAQRAGIPPDKIDAEVASVSALLGWDIRLGSRPKPQAKRRAPKRPRKPGGAGS